MPTKTKTKKLAPPGVLNIAFVWDMSGSMANVHEATRAGTHSYLSDLQKEEKKLASKHGEGIFTRFSLTAFDTVFEKWLVDEPIANVNVDQVVGRYYPRGWTALYDAVANTITELESKLHGEREGEKCLVVVMTDGQENSSVEYGGPDGKRRIFDLIKAYEAKGNWTFVYLGANVDAYAEAASLGIPKGNVASYSSTPDSVGAASMSYAAVTSSLRSSPKAQTNAAFTDSGMSQDYRDPSDIQDPSRTSQPLWTSQQKSYADSEDATENTRKAR